MIKRTFLALPHCLQWSSGHLYIQSVLKNSIRRCYNPCITSLIVPCTPPVAGSRTQMQMKRCRWGNCGCLLREMRFTPLIRIPTSKLIFISDGHLNFYWTFHPTITPGFAGWLAEGNGLIRIDHSICLQKKKKSHFNLFRLFEPKLCFAHSFFFFFFFFFSILEHAS